MERAKRLVCMILCIFNLSFATLSYAQAGSDLSAYAESDRKEIKVESIDHTVNDAGIVSKKNTDSGGNGEKISEPSDVITVMPALSMPQISYEGHNEIISDISRYTIGPNYITPKDACEKGIVSCNFTPIETDGIRISSGRIISERNVLFEKPGLYTVELSINVKDGSTYTARDFTEVKATPSIEAVLSGAKKQNRKQNINFKIASNPKFPVKDINIILENKATGEKISGYAMQNGSMSSNINSSENLKAGDVKCESIDKGLFYQGNFEFLTKYSTEQNMRITVNSTDVRGCADAYTEDFRIMPDKAPEAVIGIEKEYIREKGKNYSIITVSDNTVYDGDQGKRRWFIRNEGEKEYRNAEKTDGFEDLSMGALSKVCFRKEGLGKFYVKLEVEDVWSEGTIDRYVNSSEILSGEAYAESGVVNVAPNVSLGMSGNENAEILIAGDITEKQNIDNFSEELKIKLLEKGIHGNSVKSITDGKKFRGNPAKPVEKLFTANGKFGYEGTSTAFERDLYAVDNDALYKADCQWPDADAGFPEEPYSISSYDIETGLLRWTYTVDPSVFNMNFKKASMFQDDEGEYLYVVSNGKTLIISKETGQIAACVPYEFGEFNFVSESRIFSYRNDGIYMMDLKTGKMSHIYKAEISGKAVKTGKRVITYTMTASGQIMKLILDTDSESIRKEFVEKISKNDYIPSRHMAGPGGMKFSVNEIDSYGRAVLTFETQVISLEGYGNFYSKAVHVYDGDNNVIEKRLHKSKEKFIVSPIENRRGMCNYLALSFEGKDSVTVKVYGINSPYEKSIILEDRNGNPCIFDSVINAEEIKEKIRITLGGYCSWIYNDGWNSGYRHGYPERCKTVEFPIGTGNAAEAAEIMEGCTVYSEYGKNSDIYTAIQTGKNCQYADRATVETTVSRKNLSRSDYMIRELGKYLIKNGQKRKCRAVIIYSDGFNLNPDAEEAAAIRNIVNDRGYEIYIAGSTIGGGKMLAESLGGNFYDIDSKCADSIAGILENKKRMDSISYVKVTPDSGKNGILERNIGLERGKEYRFDMELSAGNNITADKIFKIVNNSILSMPDESYDKESYYVEKDFHEDFSGKEISKFFSYSNYMISDGMYTDCEASKDSNGNAYRGDSSLITFNIPKGKKGVLSFDYDVCRRDGMFNGNYVDIDGKRWQLTAKWKKNIESGHYIHPDILEEGKHTLKLGTCGYGSHFNVHTYIDNLNVSIVTNDAGCINSKKISFTNIGDGRYRVTGNFTTPYSFTEFKKLKGVEYVSGAAGTVAYTSYAAAGKNSNLLKINIPAGKSAIFARIGTSGMPKEKEHVWYTWENIKKYMYCIWPDNSDQYKLNSISDKEILTVTDLKGENSFKANFRSYRGTYAGYENIEMYVGNTGQNAVSENKFITAPYGAGKAIFAAENNYNGKTSLIINPDKEIKIYDFSLYMNDEGQRVNVLENGFESKKEALKWKNTDCKAEFITEMNESDGSDDNIPVFDKGELVAYNVIYSDYEGDPSKKSFWKYTHTPMNDGEFPDASVILDSSGNVVRQSETVLEKPVDRFYIDGKYTVEHWQYDDTTGGKVPGGNPEYDKSSNIAEFTFYIRGNGDAPWINYIKTVPSKVYKGDNCGLEIGIDDIIKENLNVTAKIYSNGKLIYSGTANSIKPSADGVYPPVIFNGCVPDIACGKYDSVCEVSGPGGSGIDVFTFTVVNRGNLSGTVGHTASWNENRKRFNMHYYESVLDEDSEPASYINAAGSVPRGANVFWPGEKIIINAVSEGNPTSVTAWIDGYKETMNCNLTTSGKDSFHGILWNRNMSDIWNSVPQKIKIYIKSVYSDGTYILDEKNIIMDGGSLYWNLHKAG